jgi:hypothetical protein
MLAMLLIALKLYLIVGEIIVASLLVWSRRYCADLQATWPPVAMMAVMAMVLSWPGIAAYAARGWWR